MELVAFLIFVQAVSGHRVEGATKQKLDRWIWIVVSASTVLMLVLLTNLEGCFYAALRLWTPAFAHLFDQSYLALMAWCFLVPFVWGFSEKWMPVFLGLKPPRTNILLAAVPTNLGGVCLLLVGHVLTASCLLALGSFFGCWYKNLRAQRERTEDPRRSSKLSVFSTLGLRMAAVLERVRRGPPQRRFSAHGSHTPGPVIRAI